MNWANLITYSRLVCIPIIIVLYLTEFPWHYLWAAGLFSLASLTDWADGYVARNFNQASEYGAFLDPVADKLLVVVVLVLLVANYSTVWFVLPVGAIIAREIIVSALREWMARRNQRDVVAVAFSGKLKTTVQMIAIIVLLASDPDGYPLFWMSGYVLIYLAAGLSLYSMWHYFSAAWSTLSGADENA